MSLTKREEYFGYKHWTQEEESRCFYVGKGCNQRERSRFKRSAKWKAVVARYGLRIEVCFGPATDAEARAWEIENIAKENTFTTSYSTKNGDDIRCNFTRGGDGIAGYKHSRDAIERIRQYNTGRHRTPEAIQRLKANHPMKRPEVAAKVSASKRGRLLGPQSPIHKRKRIEARVRTCARKRFQLQSQLWFRRKPTSSSVAGP